MSANLALAYSRIAANLRKKLKSIRDDTLSGDDSSEAEMVAILESFETVVLVKQEDEHQLQHSQGDLGKIG